MIEGAHTSTEDAYASGKGGRTLIEDVRAYNKDAHTPTEHEVPLETQTLAESAHEGKHSLTESVDSLFEDVHASEITRKSPNAALCATTRLFGVQLNIKA
ncbi:hypothetical protein WOLCODRAFT_167179 [Wolfiporia cocos MD-104 SS10]|uniref:Uncharacterized protein n=1 Tax=Wolfiporia cocos (strain MD-104) TaxID=742152 RepID=A0A2H3J4K9_WOLCO|nr:hypothetical protein WOLCODRAFT_167179 [Wolfiporia cocos MD-104 SS10]